MQRERSDRVAVGVDAAPDGWVAVRYHGDAFERVHRYADDDGPESAIERLWRDHDDADVVLVDVPIGLPAATTAREPERRARDVLGPRRASVFNVPIRPVLDADSYEDANRLQKEACGKGLMRQSFNIVPRIREVDALLGADDGPGATASQDVIREAHPEVCFWALNGGDAPMLYSKTGQPAAAHWERVGTLASVHGDSGRRNDGTDAPGDDRPFHDALAAAGDALVEWQDPQLGNDDLLDAFALAVTGSDLTGPLQTLPEDPGVDEMGLRMEMVYADPA